MANKEKSSVTCSSFINWFLQLGLLASIAFTIFAVKTGIMDIWIIVFPILYYIAYIINAMYSTTLTYLKHKHKANTIHECMSQLFNINPLISFHVQCYHNETRTTYETDSNGNSKWETEEFRVNTYQETEHFSYFWCKDISGTFLLETTKFIDKAFKKVYIKLELDLEVIRSDDGTEDDYITQRNAFYKRNEGKDDYMSTSETTHLRDFNQHNLVRVSDNPALFVNTCFYFFLTLIVPLVEFYKIYVNLYCEEQTFTIRKVISSRSDVCKHSTIDYEKTVPKIIIYGKEIYPEADDAIPLTLNIPNENELNINNQFDMSKRHEATVPRPLYEVESNPLEIGESNYANERLL
jgi:hypothetical protein